MQSRLLRTTHFLASSFQSRKDGKEAEGKGRQEEQDEERGRRGRRSCSRSSLVRHPPRENRKICSGWFNRNFASLHFTSYHYICLNLSGSKNQALCTTKNFILKLFGPRSGAFNIRLLVLVPACFTKDTRGLRASSESWNLTGTV